MSKHSHKHGNAEAQPAQDNAGDGEGAEAVADGDSAGTQAAEDANPEDGPVNWEQLSAELEIKLAELNDQYLRKAADFDNFRKRMTREKQELTEFANQNLLLDLLPALDDFDRAIKSAETADFKSGKDFTSFYEGIIMIEKHLASQLESKWGLKRFDSAGELFDPNRHEAIQMEKAAGIAEAVVKEDYVKGYFLKEKVIRCAKVKVLMPADGEAPPPARES
ncbi:MAG: nucleotide exchange factor GrpE [Treponema sp.]|nr:nucleotide exchange factor GrpE [Treponema sp.]